MKISFILCLLLLSPLVGLTAQAEIKSSVFIPPEYYIGDPVELRIRLKLEEDDELISPQNFLPHEWVEIRSVQVDQNGKEAELIISFTSFSTGTRTLPNLDFGLFILNDFKIYTTSLIDQGDHELKGLRGQILIPGSRLYFVIIAASVLILPYLLFFIIKYLIRGIAALIARYHIVRPYRVLLKELKKLDSGLEKISVRDYFISISDTLRIYLSARTGFDCMSATTSEISGLHGFGLEDETWERLVQVLKKGDMVKFGGEKLSLYQMKENLDFVVSVCQEIEKKEDQHADV